MNNEPLHRVFVTRHYIAVQWYDVRAKNPAQARRRAEVAARKLQPDARATATDNGWIADEPTAIVAVGQCGSDGRGRHQMREVCPGVWGTVDDAPTSPAPRPHVFGCRNNGRALGGPGTVPPAVCGCEPPAPTSPAPRPPGRNVRGILHRGGTERASRLGSFVADRSAIDRATYHYGKDGGRIEVRIIRGHWDTWVGEVSYATFAALREWFAPNGREVVAFTAA